ncbi:MULTISPECIES: helix-turn-helix domain-containing protein [Peribacillus]|uniref:helix-turn-helix domain-containing protein n=1 Tax=Peribacillus TaxID=2675229 RepID=UPI001F4EE3CF|nr:helix-turn-helix domain-containing protein [Peribacillus sp. Aquil_B1]MCK2010377.1 helix-turn-helix domain-containing protein [Peribacillus sp. Aquil_B8]
MNEFGDYLRELRGNMSLREVAVNAGISHTYIRNLELGKKNDPSHEVLAKLAKVYKVSYGNLLSKKFKYIDFPVLPEYKKTDSQFLSTMESFERFKLEGAHLDLKKILEGDFSVFYDEKKISFEKKQLILGILSALFKED